LDGLAREFTAQGGDIRFLIRSIAYSRTYQRTSETFGDAPSRELLAAMPVRALTAEQIWDSFLQSIGARDTAALPTAEILLQSTAVRRMYRASSESSSELSTTILQALGMMNGRAVSMAVTPSKGPTLTAVMEFPGWDTSQRIETLYLATLSRPPRRAELETLVEFVASADHTPDALADIFWALLNSSEFVTNH
jgi:hypothetical protein